MLIRAIFTTYTMHKYFKIFIQKYLRSNPLINEYHANPHSFLFWDLFQIQLYCLWFHLILVRTIVKI